VYSLEYIFSVLFPWTWSHWFGIFYSKYGNTCSQDSVPGCLL